MFSKATIYEIMESYNLFNTNNDNIESIVDKILIEHKEQVKQYKLGNKKIINYFIGLTIKNSIGGIDANKVKVILESKLNEIIGE